MASEGAAILDVGGKSTRPGAQQVWADDEIEPVRPVVAGLASSGAAVSFDTRKSEVMWAALQAGARLVNDVSALTFDPRSAEALRRRRPVVLMHHLGPPETMQQDPRYEDVLVEVYLWLEDRHCCRRGRQDRPVEHPDRSGVRLWKDRCAQPGTDERPCALPFAWLSVGARGEPQAHDWRAFERSPGGPASWGQHRLRSEGGRRGYRWCGSTTFRRRCRRCGSGVGFATRRFHSAFGIERSGLPEDHDHRARAVW